MTGVAEAVGTAATRYPFAMREVVRFNDCDPLGHANNALYSTYLEQARIGILNDFSDFILARVEIDFRSSLSVGERLLVESRCAGVGRASFRLEHRISSGGRLIAEAVSTMVAYDYAREASVPVSRELIARLYPDAAGPPLDVQPPRREPAAASRADGVTGDGA